MKIRKAKFINIKTFRTLIDSMKYLRNFLCCKFCRNNLRSVANKLYFMRSSAPKAVLKRFITFCLSKQPHFRVEIDHFWDPVLEVLNDNTNLRLVPKSWNFIWKVLFAQFWQYMLPYFYNKIFLEKLNFGIFRPRYDVWTLKMVPVFLFPKLWWT